MSRRTYLLVVVLLSAAIRPLSAQLEPEIEVPLETGIEEVDAVPLSLWHVVSITAEADTNMAYDGFPYRIVDGTLVLTSKNVQNCPHDACWPGALSSSCGIGIQYTVGTTTYQTVFSAPNSSYWNYEYNTVGKALSDGTNRFWNPLQGRYDPWVLYFASQQLTGAGGVTCAHSGWGWATSPNGYQFYPASQTKAPLDTCDNLPCTNRPNFWCTQFATPPCAADGSAYAGPEIFSPLILPSDSNHLYAAAFVNTNHSDPTNHPGNLWFDCPPTYETGLCWPSNPSASGTSAYILKSSDSVTWARYTGVTPSGKISSSGIDSTTPCYHAAWLINVDLASDQQHVNWYLTRSYATDYGQGCTPATLPNHVQLYQTQGDVGVYYGPWSLLIDLSCSTLGFQPDAATIVQDKKGQAVLDGAGRVTLMVSQSSSGGACARTSYRRYKVVVGP